MARIQGVPSSQAGFSEGMVCLVPDQPAPRAPAPTAA